MVFFHINFLNHVNYICDIIYTLSFEKILVNFLSLHLPFIYRNFIYLYQAFKRPYISYKIPIFLKMPYNLYIFVQNCPFPYINYINQNELVKKLKCGLMKKYRGCQDLLIAILQCSHFQDLIKVCIHCKKDTGKRLCFYHTSKYVFLCYILKKNGKIEGNIPKISQYIMKFSLFYPIFQKIWPYEMPYFWVKGHLKACEYKYLF